MQYSTNKVLEARNQYETLGCNSHPFDEQRIGSSEYFRSIINMSSVE